jgi:hypothetical protein
VTDSDAYQDEMRRLAAYREDDLDGVFTGVVPEGDEFLGDLACFFAEARTALVRVPVDAVESRHLAAVADAIQVQKASVAARSRSLVADSSGTRARWSLMWYRTLRWATTGAMVAVAAVGLTGGLALAGVDLPGTAAESAFERVVGLVVPNQDEEARGEADEAAKAPVDELACTGAPPFAGETPEGATEEEQAANRAAEAEAFEAWREANCPEDPESAGDWVVGIPPVADECAGPPPFAEVPAEPADPAGDVVPSPRAEEATTFAETRQQCRDEAGERTLPGSERPDPALSDGPPEGVADGPPEGVADGPPEGVADGPPEGVADGPPEGVADGPPEGVADGPPVARP